MAAKLSTDKALAAARKAEKAGQWAAAYAHYRSVVEKFPANKRAQKGLAALKQTAVPELLKSARAFSGQNNPAEAIEALELSFKLAPDIAEVGNALSQLLLQSKRPIEALEAAEKALQVTPDHAALINSKGRALYDLGRGDDARKTFESAVQKFPQDARGFSNLATLARSLGDPESEAANSRRALDLEPTSATYHWNVALSTKYTVSHPHLKQMQDLKRILSSEDQDSAFLYLALFKAFDDIGDRDQAFANLQQSNRLNKSTIGYEFKQDATQYALTKALMAKPLPDPTDFDSPRPIFITGLPRTGTTLTERILSRAAGVQGCGELSVVQLAVGKVLREIMSREHRAFTEEDRLRLRELLLTGLQTYSDGSPVQVDKMPLNFRWIGFICAALPEARIVHLTRDPMAVAWSLYRHTFSGQGNGFVYSFEDIAKFMVLHRDLMEHWRQTCRGFIFDLDYNDLVNDPERRSKAMAEFLGLEWTEAWTSPEKSKQQVRTASALQVRKAIYKGSDQEWKKYEKQLEPMGAALVQVGVLT